MGENEDRLKIEDISSKEKRKKAKGMEIKWIRRKEKGKKWKGRKLRIEENGKGNRKKCSKKETNVREGI